MPERIQLRRTKGWRKPEGAVVVSRPSKWGNDYKAVRGMGGTWGVTGYGLIITGYGSEAEALADVIRLYREKARFRSDLRELRGKDLACWCDPSDECHADVLIDLANA